MVAKISYNFFNNSQNVCSSVKLESCLGGKSWHVVRMRAGVEYTAVGFFHIVPLADLSLLCGFVVRRSACHRCG